jgi:undecaprenyl-diphosphatase
VTGSRRLLLAALAVFGLVTADVLAGGPLTRLDTAVSGRVRDRPVPAWFDRLTLFGEHVPVAVAVTAAVALVAWRARTVFPLVRLALLGPVTVAVVLGLKIGVGRQPPSGVDPSLPWRSYPSGHTVTAVVLWGLLAAVVTEHTASPVARTATRLLGWLGPVLVVTGMLLRDYHWVSDLIGGAALGVVLLQTERLTLRHWWRAHGGSAAAGVGSAGRGAAPVAPGGGG